MRADPALAELVGARRAEPVLPERVHVARARLLPGLRVHRPGPVRGLFTKLVHCLHPDMFACMLMQVHVVHLRSVPEDYVPGAADAVVQVKRKVPPRQLLFFTYSRDSFIAVPSELRVCLIPIQ